MAGEARAANLVLTVYAGAGTSGTVIYTQNGGTQSLNGDAGALTTALAAHGFSAYSFSNIGASSNNPGDTTNGYILASGNMQVGTGTGANTPITIVVSEGGFFSPASATGNMLHDVGQSNYVNTATDSTTKDTGTFMSSSPTVNVSTPSFTLTSPAGPVFPGQQGSASTSLPAYSTPYTLVSQSIISLSPGTGATANNPASLGFSNKVLVTAAVPEPASIVMMLTGMPLPLVVMGLLRRRRRAAA